VEFLVPEIAEPEVESQFSVLFEDPFLLVINKPGNLPCHPAGRYFNNTLWTQLKEQYNLPYLSIINRLDRETSGIVLCAKKKETARQVQLQFKKRLVQKRYIVFVEGCFPSQWLSARGHIGNNQESVIRKKCRFFAHSQSLKIKKAGKSCHTLFKGVRAVDGISQVLAIPTTGRLHQIRASLHGLGYPVVGDKLYGVDENFFLKFINGGLSDHDRTRLRITRQALHGAELRFTHPESGERLRFTAPLPKDLEDLMRPRPLSHFP
jgi:23S rRNA pseudouridine955/2504/2580 synthase/23S rRNA pseudouridine1911/1915/1917 synthase